MLHIMLDRERKYFSKNKAELVASHLGKFVVIKGLELVGAFNTVEEAIGEGARRFGLEPFLVRLVAVADEGEVHIPALSLGILNANSTRSV